MNVLTKRISALMEYNFSIPVYQRGYRWDDQQISDLLDDLFEFSASPKTSYYCLQPIVVKQREDGAYDVLDGQQRLTTIYILLSYLYPVRQILHKATCDQLYRLKFDQRDDDYLNEKRFRNDTMAEYKTDINKFYIWKAYEAIDLWFNNKNNCESQILYALLGQQGTEETHVTKVIWYDVTQSADSSIDIFTRLNYGKIPLPMPN